MADPDRPLPLGCCVQNTSDKGPGAHKVKLASQLWLGNIQHTVKKENIIRVKSLTEDRNFQKYNGTYMKFLNKAKYCPLFRNKKGFRIRLES